MSYISILAMGGP